MNKNTVNKVFSSLLKLYPNNIVGMKDSSGDLDHMLKITKFYRPMDLKTDPYPSPYHFFGQNNHRMHR